MMQLVTIFWEHFDLPKSSLESIVEKHCSSPKGQVILDVSNTCCTFLRKIIQTSITYAIPPCVVFLLH